MDIKEKFVLPNYLNVSKSLYNLSLTSVDSPVISFSAYNVDIADGGVGAEAGAGVVGSTVISSVFGMLALDPLPSF